MESKEIRERFLKFFEKRGHAVVPSASLVPENDPSVLFTTAGMQPLIPYLLGEKHPAGDKLVNVQKCVRTQDIEEVGDNTHDTFFEMLGNWSLGSYFKNEAIEWSFDFLTSKEEGLGLDPARLYITVFGGNADAPRDDESYAKWRSLGVPENHIYWMEGELAAKNWWSPGDNGPCGPDTEMFYDVVGGLNLKSLDEFLEADSKQQIVEIWNDVFMEYQKKDGKVVGKLSQKNVDTGAGLERLAMVMQQKDNIFDTDLFAPLMTKIGEFTSSDNVRAQRVVADHIRTSVFMIADGVTPSNTDRGYILRRLLRRAVRYSDILEMKSGGLSALSEVVINKYKNVYQNVGVSADKIKKEIDDEEVRFRKTLEAGMRELMKIANSKQIISGEDAFNLFQSYGLPLELTVEIMEQIGRMIDKRTLSDSFFDEFKKHQELSRQGAEQKFKGGLLDHSPQSVKYHTATHLLHQALRQVLGTHVFQKGSNITPERLRFDFSFERKMTDEEKQKVEDIVNAKIKEALPVSYEDIPLAEAEKKGAIGLFEEKYGDKVRVYKVGDFSLEFCGGPHVSNTGELGRFKIQKEEASSAGIRRIKAVLE